MKYDFPVELKPIESSGILIPNKMAVIRTDINQPIGLVSNKYGILKHSDVIDNVRESVKQYKTEEKIVMEKNGAILFSTYKFIENKVKITNGDEVAMQLVIKNSYDGSNSFQMILGGFRLVCSNGMIIGDTFFNYSVKHFQKDIETDLIKNIISESTNRFLSAGETMMQMSKIDVSKNDDLFKIKMSKYLIEEAKAKYEQEDKTLWNYYNSLTFAISHKMRKERIGLKNYYLNMAWEQSVKFIK